MSDLMIFKNSVQLGFHILSKAKMFRPTRQVQVPRYNSKRPQNFSGSDIKYSKQNLVQDMHQSQKRLARAAKFSKKEQQKRIKFEKQNFMCNQHRNACEENSQRGFNLGQSAQSASIMSERCSLKQSSKLIEESNSSIGLRSYPSSALVGLETQQDLDPIIKYLLSSHKPQLIQPIAHPIRKKQQKSQNQPANRFYCQANMNSKAYSQPSSQLTHSQQLQNRELLMALRAKMIENLVMLFRRIINSLQAQLEAPVQEMSILANLIPVQVQKIHLVSSYLRRALERLGGINNLK